LQAFAMLHDQYGDQEAVTQPLILTLQLDAAAQGVYENLRRLYFPAERNLISAHLTLFHKLPDDEVTHEVLREAAQVTAEFPLVALAIRSIGRGVAVFFQAKEITVLHAALSSVFRPDLTPQDSQRFQPHIVVQNKVDAETVKRTLSQLRVDSIVEPRAIGLTVWRYLDGPWEHLYDLPFRGERSSRLP
jgi:2'-5' RNA ligase